MELLLAGADHWAYVLDLAQDHENDENVREALEIVLQPIQPDERVVDIPRKAPSVVGVGREARVRPGTWDGLHLATHEVP